MSTILPPPPTPQPLPTASPAPTIATVSNPPAALSQLPLGSLVRADIVQVLARGLANVQTDYGAVQIRANLALAQGTKLELQLLRVLPQVQFAIRAVDGQLLTGAPARNPTAQGAATQHSTSASIAAQTAGTPSRSPAAHVSTAGAGAQLPELAVGGIVRGTVLRAIAGTGGQGPAAGSSGLPPSATPTPGTAAPGTAPTAAPAVSPTPLAFPTGTHLEVRIAALVPPGQPQPASTGGSTHGHTNGTITALGGNGRPIVETSFGIISLEASSDARIGTQVQLSILPATAGTRSPLIPTGVTDTFALSRSWPALEQAVSYLAQRPDSPQLMPQQAIPQANQRLGAAFLLFLNALKANDMRAWLGAAASILDRERPDLAGRLNDDFAQLARAFNEASPDDWRTAVIPFLNGSQLEPIQMHIRGGKSQRGDEDEKEGSRFIIDVELSRMGRVQLDGFVKKRGRDDKKTFDLIVRTERRLTQRMHADIHRIFSSFSESSGLIGALSFQARGQFVDVSLPRLLPVAPNGLVV